MFIKWRHLKLNIYHYTDYFLRDKISKEGLIFNKQKIKADFGTGIINSIIDQYKPMNLPKFINRNKCIFFSFKRDEDMFGFQVDSKSLNQSRLFVFNYNTVQKLYDLHVTHRTVGECRGEFERFSKCYWDSAVPFTKFERKVQGLCDKEILYFNVVPPHCLKVIRDESEEFINIANKAVNYFDICESDFNEFEILKDGKRKCSCTYIISKKMMHVDFDYDIDIETSKLLKKIIEDESVIYEGVVIRLDGVYKIGRDGETLEGKLEAFK